MCCDLIAIMGFVVVGCQVNPETASQGHNVTLVKKPWNNACGKVLVSPQLALHFEGTQSWVKCQLVCVPVPNAATCSFRSV